MEYQPSGQENNFQDIWENIGKLDDKTNILARYIYDSAEQTQRLNKSKSDLDEFKFEMVLDVLKRQMIF